MPSRSMFCILRGEGDDREFLALGASAKRPKWTKDAAKARWFAYRSYADAVQRAIDGTRIGESPRSTALLPIGGQKEIRKKSQK